MAVDTQVLSFYWFMNRGFAGACSPASRLFGPFLDNAPSRQKQKDMKAGRMPR